VLFLSQLTYDHDQPQDWVIQNEIFIILVSGQLYLCEGDNTQQQVEIKIARSQPQKATFQGSHQTLTGVSNIGGSGQQVKSISWP
jgi:hypothetical protein